jgi:Aspartyl/Asparaginyl beta-hydroxylase
MRLHRPLVKLPFTIDAEVLAAEVAGLDEAMWREHPEGAPGNTAVPLLARSGDPVDDSTVGPMAPTPALAMLPYTRQVLAALGSTIGRTRLMRIAHETELAAHVDINYYWWHHLRIHVPVVSTPDVRFTVGDETVHMAPGEVWTFDTWTPHRVENPASTPRIHLVVDTVGGPGLWAAIDAPDGPVRDIAWRPGDVPPLPLETANWPDVMAPDEVDAIVAVLTGDITGDDAAVATRILAAFRHAWRDRYAQFGTDPAGRGARADLLRDVHTRLVAEAGAVVLPNGRSLVRTVEHLLVAVANGPSGARPAAPTPAPPAAGTVVITGTIVAGNADGTDDIAGAPDAANAATITSSIIGAINHVTVTDGGGNQNGVVDPGLAPLADNGGPTQTMALVPSSVAIDAGPNPVPDFPGNGADQRGEGFARVVGAKADVGAFEVQAPPPPPVIIAPKFTG